MTRKPRYSDACAARYADGTPVAEGDMCMLGLDVRRVAAVVWGETTSSVVFDDGLEPASVDVATDGRTDLELCVPGADGRPIHKGTLVVCDGESGDGEPWYVKRVTRGRYPVECGGSRRSGAGRRPLTSCPGCSRRPMPRSPRRTRRSPMPSRRF